MGASDNDMEQVWTWNTGDEAKFHKFTPNWKPYNKTLNNLVLERETSKWKDVTDLEKHGFVCEAEPGVCEKCSVSF